MRASSTLVLLLVGCVTDEGARGPSGPTEVEGLVRRRDATCGERRGFQLAVASAPVAGRRFSIRVDSASGTEVTTVLTSEEGAFRATLPPGRYCFVDVTVEQGTACAGVLRFDPKTEPVPVVVLSPLPCAR